MSGMLDRVHDLYDELERNCVLLSFKGGLNPELISVILGLVERKLASMENDQRSRKRVFNVVVECLQNLYHHNRQKTSTDEPADQVREPQGVVDDRTYRHRIQCVDRELHGRLGCGTTRRLTSNCINGLDTG